MPAKLQRNQYVQFLKELKTKIRDTQIKAAASINRELIQLYWEIGQKLSEKEKKLGWGR